jgi:hypothetical protein
MASTAHLEVFYNKQGVQQTSNNPEAMGLNAMPGSMSGTSSEYPMCSVVSTPIKDRHPMHYRSFRIQKANFRTICGNYLCPIIIPQKASAVSLPVPV